MLGCLTYIFTTKIKKTMNALFQDYKDENVKLIFGTGAIYGVDNALIMRNSVDFYVNCMNVLNNSAKLG